jgi:hypothetical protein
MNENGFEKAWASVCGPDVMPTDPENFRKMAIAFYCAGGVNALERPTNFRAEARTLMKEVLPKL